MQTDVFYSRPLTDGGALLGRLLLGAIFVWFGLAKAMAASGTIAYFTKLGLPAPSAAYVVTVVIELGVGLMFVLGLFGRSPAMILAFWCIATAITGHSDFSDRNMLIHFYKNVSMCGGFIYAAFGLPPEKWSSLRYGFEPCGGCHHGTEEAYG